MALGTICDEYCCSPHSVECFFPLVQTENIDDMDYDFYRREKMPSGMTAEFRITRFFYAGNSRNDHKLVLSPAFIVFHKRKKYVTNDNIPLEITGKDGLRPLIFAKECMKQLEKTIVKDWRYHKYKDIVISVGWLDNRRGKLYKKLLSKEGYEPVFEEGGHYLNKYVRKDHVNLV